MSKLRKYTKEWLEELCESSFSYAQVLAKAGRKIAGGNHVFLKIKIEEFNVDVSHFTGKLWSKNLTKHSHPSLAGKKGFAIEDIFREISPVGRKIIRSYVKDLDLIEYKCLECGNIGEWRNNIIALHLDHINGVATDHRLENLRWLCPNCHSATDTYAGKNNRSK